MQSLTRTFSLAYLCCAYAIDLNAQGSFENLGFEAANIPAGTQPGASITVSEGMPGWTPSTSTIYYDNASLGGALITVIDSSSPYTVLQGNYSVILFAGPDVGAAGASSISQIGLVPANAQSIQMDIAYPYGVAAAGSFTVTLGGQTISMSPLQTMANYTVYGGNVASYAGDVETLAITQYPPIGPTTPPSALTLDDIVFSPTAVPEPQTWTLLLCGAGAFAAWRRKQTQ